MNPPLEIEPRGGRSAAGAILAAVAVVFGLFSGLPFPLGALIGAAGAGASIAWRSSRKTFPSSRVFVPYLVAVSVIALAAPPGPVTESLAGISGLALLVWMADDPTRTAGGERRAIPAIVVGAVVVGVAGVVAVLGERSSSDVGIGGGLLAVGVVLIAILLARLRYRPVTLPIPT